MYRKALTYMGGALLAVSAMSVHASERYDFCGSTPELPASDTTPPLVEDLYLRGSHSGWGASEEFRFDYRGDSVYQLRTSLESFTTFKVASGDDGWTQEIWVPNASGVGTEQQGLEVNQWYPVNHSKIDFQNNLLFATGELLFTLSLTVGEEGNAQRGALRIDRCTLNHHRTPSIDSSRTLSKTSTLVPNLGANEAVTIGPDGALYVADFGTFAGSSGTGTEIKRVDASGNVSVYASGLNGPLGGFWSEGSLYVIDDNKDFASGKLLRVDPQGQHEVVAEIAGFPTNGVVDNHGNFIVGNFAFPSLTKVTPSGQVEQIMEDPDLLGVVGMVWDKRRHKLFAANYNSGKILAIDLHGEVHVIAQVPAQIGYLTLMGNKLYGTGLFSNRIYEISLNGKVKILTGTGAAATADGTALSAEFNNPNGIASDASQNRLYISELGGQNSFRVIDLLKKSRR